MKQEFKPINEFIGDTNKSKLTDTQAYLTLKNNLLFCVKFLGDSEIYLLGEESETKKAVENPDNLSRYRKSLLMYSEEKPIGNLLFESNYFVENNLQAYIPTFDALILSMDEALNKLVSDVNMLRQSWSEGSIFEKIFINYFCFKFFRTKHLAATKTPLTAHKQSVRREMYTDLKKEIDREFDLISQNPTSLSDLKNLRLKSPSDFNDVIFCYSFEDFYVQYISYLASRDMFFRICKRCGKAFYRALEQMSISFHPDDKVDYITAYQIARDFAEKFAHDKGYEVLFAVHTDTDHVHAHFLISNCNMENGLSYRRNQRDLYEMSEYFGEQCVKHGFTRSVRDDFYNKNPEKARDKKTFAEVQMKKRGAESFKDELREVIQIELADPRNLTFEDVVRALKEHYNVECRVAGNTISYRHPEYLDKNKKPVSVRGSKLGNLYTRKGLEYELTKKRTSDRGTNPRAGNIGPIADYNRVTAELERFVDANRELSRGNSGTSSGQVRNNAASVNNLRNVRHSKSLYGEHKVGADNNAERPERVQRKRSGRGR